MCILGITVSSMAQTRGFSVEVFLGHECPISQKYIKVLNDLKEEYDGQVQFQGWLAVHGVSQAEVDSFVEAYDISFPVLSDARLYNAHKLGATITPEAYLKNSEGEVLYSGAIDNWYYDLGRYRRKATEHYLKSAIDLSLAGKAIILDSAQAVGCFIDHKMTNHNHMKHE